MTPREIREAETLAKTYDGYSPDKDEFADPDAPDSYGIALHIALSVVICVVLIAVGFAWGSR